MSESVRCLVRRLPPAWLSPMYVRVHLRKSPSVLFAQPVDFGSRELESIEMSLARNIELYHDRIAVDMALSGKAGTVKVHNSSGKSAQTMSSAAFRLPLHRRECFRLSV
jgi:hypothetical protein